jgi:segregation and condensation protein B
VTPGDLRNVLEAALLAAGRALSLDDLLALFEGSPDAPDRAALRGALDELAASLEGRALELKEVASGYRLQVRQAYSPWLGGLFAERPPRYSRALLETLALIAYRQPITRGEIEDVRGVAVSTNIIKTLMEREWIRVLGHREVPGRPALYGTTRAFLDHFGLTGLDGLPPLAEIRDLDQVEPDLFGSLPAEEGAAGAVSDAPSAAAGEVTDGAVRGDVAAQGVDAGPAPDEAARDDAPVQGGAALDGPRAEDTLTLGGAVTAAPARGDGQAAPGAEEGQAAEGSAVRSVAGDSGSGP